MTKEENIATLNEHLTHWKRLLSEKICDQSEGEKTIDALQNAIKALEQEPCDDAISRQAVIDTLTKTSGIRGDALKALYDLPSVTPQPCGDCISREAVMHILDEVGGDFDSPREAVVPIDYIADMVSELPFVTAQTKMGRWIEHIHNGMHYIECPKCSSWFLRMYLTRNSYCPNCGAKMQEVEG